MRSLPSDVLKKQLQALEKGQLSRAEKNAIQKWEPEESMGKKTSPKLTVCDGGD